MFLEETVPPPPKWLSNRCIVNHCERAIWTPLSLNNMVSATLLSHSMVSGGLLSFDAPKSLGAAAPLPRARFRGKRLHLLQFCGRTHCTNTAVHTLITFTTISFVPVLRGVMTVHPWAQVHPVLHRTLPTQCQERAYVAKHIPRLRRPPDKNCRVHFDAATLLFSRLRKKCLHLLSFQKVLAVEFWKVMFKVPGYAIQPSYPLCELCTC